MKTKAAVLVECGRPRPFAKSRPIEIIDLDLDPPGEGEVLLKVLACGVCGTDNHIFEGELTERVYSLAARHAVFADLVADLAHRFYFRLPRGRILHPADFLRDGITLGLQRFRLRQKRTALLVQPENRVYDCRVHPAIYEARADDLGPFTDQVDV